jgi:hypothetical protein
VTFPRNARINLGDLESAPSGGTARIGTIATSPTQSLEAERCEDECNRPSIRALRVWRRGARDARADFKAGSRDGASAARCPSVPGATT